jgi:hypothetical protein
MACDLERIFGALADQVPEHDEDSGTEADDDEDEIVFNVENLPRAPDELRTDSISIRRGSHDYCSTPIETVDLCASKRTLRLLGLLILSKVFHSRPAHVILHIGKPDVETNAGVRRLILDYDPEETQYYGYVTKPHRFRYTPDRKEKHPWYERPLEPLQMPILFIAGENWDLGRMPGEDLDTAVGFGTDEGHVNFAELLLDASMPWNERDEFALEGECGFRGVGPGSAEIDIYLPGHLFYDEPIPWP